MCFLAGANLLFVGEALLTTPDPEQTDDFDLFKELGIEPMTLGATTSVQAE